MADDARERLAAALDGHCYDPVGMVCHCGVECGVVCDGLTQEQHLADVLMSSGVVDAIAGKRAAEKHSSIVREATDLCWKATPFTEDENGFIAAYLLPAGVVHRLLGALQGAGYSAAFRNSAAALDASPTPAPVAHNHTRFRNDAGPWSPCPVSCPAAGLLR